MSVETWLFPITVIVLIITELLLVYQLYKLRAAVHKLNESFHKVDARITSMFDGLLGKIEHLVSLFITSHAPKFKGASFNITGEQSEINLKVEKSKPK